MVVASAVLFQHPSSLLHDIGPHPEQPARITAINEALAAVGDAGFVRHESPQATRQQLEAVHPAAHIDAIEELCRQGGGAIDADTAVGPHSHTAALHAAGGACAMVDVLLNRDASVGASLHRPPGHHAETSTAMGFCLYNSVAVAARHARDAHGCRRVLIVDWDVHHGNGTQEIFYATDEVLFVSLHEWPLYPGTGAPEERGQGAGLGATLNLPVPAGSGDAAFSSLVTHVVVPAARQFGPELVLISAGFDAHARDPLAGCTVTESGFRLMAQALRALADELDVPLGLVLEGGYDLQALAASVVVTLEAMVAPGPMPMPDVPVHELARQALMR